MTGTSIANRRELLAFVHIEKAAGTTLIHLLRTNFFLRYCDVRPLNRSSRGVFTADDLKRIFQINPFLQSIGGHAISPSANLHTAFPGIQYITLLREPVSRYISQYVYWTEKLKFSPNLHDIKWMKKLKRAKTFDEFLELESESNWQTKKIAGREALEPAIKLLKDSFLLTGTVEEFDQFLVLLTRKLKPRRFLPFYRPLNRVNPSSKLKRDILRRLGRYKERIIENNQLDLELYDYVRTQLVPDEIKHYGPEFGRDLDRLQNANRGYRRNLLRYLDFGFRKMYIDPVLGFIRKTNGLPAYGSY